MKKTTLIICYSFAISALFAQHSNNREETGFVTCSEFHITRPLSEIFANTVVENKFQEEHEMEDREGNIPQRFPKTVEKDGPAYGNDPSTLQKEMGRIPGRSPLQSWTGQSLAGAYPLDPTGAAGPNNFLQMINSTTFRIWNKIGTQLLSGTLGALWTPATGNDGDPIAMYDKPADRWFMAQFNVSANKIYIAISATPDPTGSWYTYTFTSSFFPDYLKFSVWADGYYMTCNTNSSGSAPTVFVFERDKMLLGNSGARMITKTYSPPHIGNWFFVPLTGDIGDGKLPAPGSPCPIFSYSDNGWGGSYVDAVNIYKMAVNWVPATPTASITSAGSVSASAFDASYNTSWDDVSQPGTSQKLDGIGGALMIRAQYKSWSGYNSVVLNWAVKISTTQRSIKWCELRQDSTSGVWSMYQQGIYTPDTDTRWMGSVAMDNNGAIGLCYMKDNSTNIYPGLYYTGRRPCDPLGTLPITESVAMAGIASQNGVNRDGDYSETWLDPDGYTFWHTGMYFGAGGAQKTQVFSFVLPRCVSSAPPVANFTASQRTICSGKSITFTDLSTNAPTSYLWSFAGGTPATDTSSNPTVVFGSSGTYAVTLTATNSFGSGNYTQTSYITVNATPATPIATSNSPVCNQHIINLSTDTVPGASYSWTGPVSFTSSLQNPTRTATGVFSGTYSVTVTTNGCKSLPGTVSVVVKPNPSAPTFAGSTTVVCAGNTISLLTPTVANITYNWSGPNTFASTTQNQSIPLATAAMAGTYTLVVTDTNGCTNSGTVTVAVGTVTPPTPTISINGIALQSSSSTGNQWYFNGTIIPGATFQIYTPTSNGVYSVVVTVTGCPSAASASMTITNAGIEEYSEDNTLDIYPNPSDGEFIVTFHSSTKKTYTLKLIDALGQLVYLQTFADVSGDFIKPIDISVYGKGVYLFILTEAKNQTVKKVVVY